jgi:hypothetical protein
MMNNDNGTAQNYFESPASWNTRYITPDGFTCQLTLRSENGKELLERANSALSYLRELNCIPFFGYQKYNDHQNDETSHEKPDDQQSNDDPAWCPIHQVEMKKWSKDGKVWYSHKTEDGAWCSGKPKNGKK